MAAGMCREGNNWYPEYPDLGATVSKFRRKARGSIYDLSREERVAYADAIEKAIRAKHRTLHMKPTPALNAPKIKLTPIGRLFKYDQPLKMEGDPNWIPKCDCPRYGTCKCDHWRVREQAVYAAMMKEKRALSPIAQAAE